MGTNSQHSGTASRRDEPAAAVALALTLAACSGGGGSNASGGSGTGGSPSASSGFPPHILLSADDGGTGSEPWISDGTAAAPRRLANLLPRRSSVRSRPDLALRAPASSRRISGQVWGGVVAP